MSVAPNPWISFKNSSGETIPAHACLQLADDCNVDDTTGVISVNVVKPDGTGPYAISAGYEVPEDGFGECQFPIPKLAWARYTDSSPPGDAWTTEVGPISGDWIFDSSGLGYLYAGVHEADNERILVKEIGGGGGGGGAQGRLLSAIAPCDNALTGATTFTFARYVENSSIDPQTDPATMMEEVDSSSVAVETTGVNRSPLEAAADGHVVCVKINGEWVPVLVFDVCRT